jgi:redox-sensitive bicupin YhaK (pirin superfamily)
MKRTPEPPFSAGPLGFPWQTRDPFLFCVHHLDHYPAGTERLGPPKASLAGRDLGMDFTIKDGWRMYHGDVVPGFPAHPHRGFETVTLARRGFIDHSDSLGATARFGQGDVQWMTAGKGIVHCEMFPLVRPDADNTVELFQIWLNLPARHKMVEPHFSMLWAPTIPKRSVKDEAGRETRIAIVAGRYGEAEGPPPPPKSWAASADHDVAIWTIELEPEAAFEIPAAAPDANRTLYFFDGASIEVAGHVVDRHAALHLHNADVVTLRNGPKRTELLMLQGRPIGEPVAQHGPFVMNTRAEIAQAMMDYQRTRFGGWPWPSPEPVHSREAGRFAKHADGRVEKGR